MKVFLGGTCNGSTWRDELIPMLKVDYFNPLVENWTEADYLEELKQREECDLCLYVITPKMTGVYSIAEAVDDSNKRPEKTIFCLLFDSEHEGAATIVFNHFQYTSLDKVGRMIKANGGEHFTNLQSVANYINDYTIPTDEPETVYQ